MIKLNELFKNTSYSDTLFSEDAVAFIENEILIKTAKNKENVII